MQIIRSICKATHTDREWQTNVKKLLFQGVTRIAFSSKLDLVFQQLQTAIVFEKRFLRYLDV